MEPIDFCSLTRLELMCPVGWFDFRKLLANHRKKWQKKFWQSLGSVRLGAIFMHVAVKVPQGGCRESPLRNKSCSLLVKDGGPRLAGPMWHPRGSLLPMELPHFPLPAILLGPPCRGDILECLLCIPVAKSHFVTRLQHTLIGCSFLIYPAPAFPASPAGPYLCSRT